ncbi:hypothetical protein V1478_017335 [Vespula squamosa]|uniref:Uncharacterized protein n=1 Tax=Vespula squamosa TaxID=30214 RepID=A0ABD1ZY76_VESSQ
MAENLAALDSDADRNRSVKEFRIARSFYKEQFLQGPLLKHILSVICSLLFALKVLYLHFDISQVIQTREKIAAGGDPQAKLIQFSSVIKRKTFWKRIEICSHSPGNTCDLNFAFDRSQVLPTQVSPRGGCCVWRPTS